MANVKVYKVEVHIPGNEDIGIADVDVDLTYSPSYILEDKDDERRLVRSVKVMFSEQYNTSVKDVRVWLLGVNGEEVWVL